MSWKPPQKSQGTLQVPSIDPQAGCGKNNDLILYNDLIVSSSEKHYDCYIVTEFTKQDMTNNLS